MFQKVHMEIAPAIIQHKVQYQIFFPTTNPYYSMYIICYLILFSKLIFMLQYPDKQVLFYTLGRTVEISVIAYSVVF